MKFTLTLGIIAIAGMALAGCGEGKGSTPAMSQAVDGRSDDDLFTGLIDGIGSMPAMGSQLSDQEIADVVAFIKLPN